MTEYTATPEQVKLCLSVRRMFPKVFGTHCVLESQQIIDQFNDMPDDQETFLRVILPACGELQGVKPKPPLVKGATLNVPTPDNRLVEPPQT